MPHRTLLRSGAPAERWVEAFPLGNGRLGAMVFGGRTGARVQVNDACAWSGRPDGPREALAELVARGAGPAALAELRGAVAAQDDARATALAQLFQGRYAQAFQPLADVVTDLVPSHDLRADGRTLDLRDGIAGESWSGSGVRVVQEWFTSAVDGCLHGRWASDAGASDATTFDLRLGLSSVHPTRDLPEAAGADADDGGGGTAPDADGRTAAVGVLVDLPHDVAPAHEPGFEAVTRSGRGPAVTGVVVLAVTSDGVVRAGDRGVDVRGATWVEAVLATATTLRWPGPAPLLDPAAAAAEASRRAHGALPSGVPAGDAARARHVEEHRGLADRSTLRLGAPGALGDLVLDLPVARTRAAAAVAGADVAQAAYAFGRYLLMASSRPGSPPATLQGLWNEQVQPPWSSAYTMNINLQMAYWAADRAGLPECFEPFVDLVRLLAREGGHVARELYGVRGWVAHHNSDVWGWALPVGAGHGDPSWAAWWAAGPWLCQHLWSHWQTTGDVAFLRDVGWPLLRGAALFCVDWLVERPDGTVVPSPSSSPENVFRRPDGTTAALCAGSAADVALVRALLASCLESCEVLGLDEPEAVGWRRALDHLPLPEVDDLGLLREWPGDVVAVDPHHRHLSHLVGLYPLEQVDVDDTPALARAASRSLDARGPGSTGWSLAWKIALRARLGQGDHVEALLAEALAPADDEGGEWVGGLLPNLFSTHPPFQVDGNLGLVAAIGEAVVGSTAARLRVLPALPPSWADGELVGVRTHGGLVVDVRWHAGELVELVLRPGADMTRRVVHGDVEREITVTAGSVVRLGPGLGALS